MKTFIAGTANALVLAAMASVGFYQIEDAAAQQRISAIDTDAKYCLQQNIYFEARNQSTLGQASVAWVTLNRVESTRYPDDICGVVWQNKQFSWTHDGKSDEPGTSFLEQQAWEKAGVVTDVVLMEWARARQSPVEDATMYHATWMDKAPYWASSYNEITTIEDHIFYN